MARIIAIHIDCGGPVSDDDTIYPGDTAPFLTDETFEITCFTCLSEISDRAELRLTEFNPQ